MREILDLMIDDFHERTLPDLLPRERTMDWKRGKANVVIGMRRTGKTWFCYQKMKELIASGVEKERLLYLNFEDERLLPFSAADFQLILETYYRKFPAFKDEHCYFFLDEVQRIEGWEKYVRRLLDSEELSVCVTGSSSKLLSTEIATSLRGRSLTTEIFPFSFREYLEYRDVNISKTESFSSKMRATLQGGVEGYLKIGGFPEIQDDDNELRRQILRNYVDIVILRDVVERHVVRNVAALRALIKQIMRAPATRFSVNKFYNDLKSQGLACTKNDLYDFMDYLTDAFLVYQVPIHARSERVRRVNPQKVYVVDAGLLEAMSLRTTGDRGALLENLVFLYLRRKGVRPEYYLTEDGFEVDFVIAEDARRRSLIQVCWNMSDDETRRREIGSLSKAMKELGVKKGTIITWMDEGHEDGGIEFIPAWKWLVQK
jgi:hypothetical protein